ncbi:hypothetical protein N7456_001265 [Penicillium angulare]|uniref:BTB domain-containing protein n=1 Tax=Penicillium angulare TaxID=116970 RepID=A0A9W9GE28_9EURO|nr:hypothetical protein N7456_001265 [Penicillium angulare]
MKLTVAKNGRIKAGPNGKVFLLNPASIKVHPGPVLHAGCFGLRGPCYDEPLDLTGYDEDTILCALIFLCTGDYCAIDPLFMPWRNAIQEGQAIDPEAVSIESLRDVSDAMPKAARAHFHHEHLTRTLTSRLASEPPTDRISEVHGEMALLYAKVFRFAHMYLIDELEKHALRQLDDILDLVRLQEVGILPRLAEIAKHVYSVPLSRSSRIARYILTEHVMEVDNGAHSPDLESIFRAGGEFAVDIYRLTRCVH